MAYLVEGEGGEQVLVVLPHESVLVKSEMDGALKLTHKIHTTRRRRLIMCGIE